jgi:CubicO group peptidase (beta-lactamase class C family)
MKRLVSAVVALMLLGTFLSLNPAHAREVEERSLASCAQVNKKFPSGVALSRSSRETAVAAGFRAPQVKPKTFRQVVARIKPTLKGVVCPVRRSGGDDPQLNQDPQLSAMADRARDAGASCFVVRRDGRVVGEWYWQGRQATTPSVGFSTMKAVSATLIGIAETKGLLSIDQPASDFITEWRGTPSSGVTIRQLLSMTSGREMRPGDALALTVSPDPTSYAVNLGQVSPPGTVWRNSDSAVQTLARVLTRATGESVLSFAQRELLRPLGMDSTILNPDLSGGVNMAFMYLTTCRDLSALVQLYVDGGVWKGQRILSQQFLQQALSPSSSFMPGYGFLNRLNTPNSLGFIPSLPTDAFDFLGLCGQIGRGVPSQRLVFAAMITAGIDQAATCDPEGRRIGELRNALVLP